MKRLTAIVCLTLAVLLGSAGMSWSADLQKGLDAYYKGDYATALRELKLLAEQGNAGAQALLGALYAEGKGSGADNEYGQGGYDQDSLPDYESAAKWFRLAAEQEVAAAQLNLGWMYHQGNGVGQDYKEALKWLGLAAEQWSPVENGRAQTLLGIMYAEGQGVTKNYETALKFFRLAAEHERAAAQYALGIMYHKGQGVPRDYETAEKWYKLAIAPRSVSTPNFSDTSEINAQAQAKNNLRILKEEIGKLKKQTKDKKGDFLSLEELKNKCTELGFTKGTEKHGDCVMKLYK